MKVLFLLLNQKRESERESIIFPSAEQNAFDTRKIILFSQTGIKHKLVPMCLSILIFPNVFSSDILGQLGS